jgi:hypothetical protein
MKSKVYIGAGTLIFIAAATFRNLLLLIAGVLVMVTGLLVMYGMSSGVEYNETQYRIYNQFLFWRKGEWKQMAGVRRIYIRHHAQVKQSWFIRKASANEESNDLTIEFQVYFVRKSGYYKIFASNSLQAARVKAEHLAAQYNLEVEEKGAKEDYAPLKKQV